MFPVAAQQPGAKGMKSANGKGIAVAAHQPPQPLAHFPRRLVGESHRQNPVRAYPLRPHQPGDAMGNDAGFAAARPGDNQQRAVHRFHRFPLRRVQALQKIRVLKHPAPSPVKFRRPIRAAALRDFPHPGKRIIAHRPAPGTIGNRGNRKSLTPAPDPKYQTCAIMIQSNAPIPI